MVNYYTSCYTCLCSWIVIIIYYEKCAGKSINIIIIGFYYYRFGSMYFILPHNQDNKIVNTSSLKEDRVSKTFLFRLDLC